MNHTTNRLAAKESIFTMLIVLLALWSLMAAPEKGEASPNMNTLTYLDNGTIKLGIDVTWGGSISYLSVSDNVYNLVNRHDAGRLIQQSYYGAGMYSGCRWGANPVQGGDIRNNPSGILSYFNDNTTVYVKSRPLDWCLSNVPSNAYMENWYTLEGNAVKVVNRFHNFDPGFGSIRDQELPAIFTLETLSSFTRYAGQSPFTGDTLTTSTVGFPNVTHYQSEAWGTHLDGNGEGLGWYTPNVYYSTNYVYTGSGSGGEYGDKVSYTAPVYRFAVFPDESFQYEYFLVVGTAADTRSLAAAKQYQTASAWDFAFDGDRDGWSISAAADGDGPNGGAWRLTPPANNSLSLVSPPVTIPSSQNLLEIKLDNNTGATSLEFAWQRSGYEEPNRTLYSNSVIVPIQSNNEMTTYTYDLSNEPNWSGVIQSLKLTVTASSYSHFNIDSLRLIGSGGSAPVVASRSEEAMNGELAKITFSTDVGATALVEYGDSTTYGLHTPDNINLMNEHIVYLSELTPGSTVHYRIRTRDRNGNESVSADDTFIMPNDPGYAKLWSFETDADPEGWIAGDGLSENVSGGIFTLMSSGGDLNLLSPDSLGINASVNRYMKIRVKNETSSDIGRLFFITDSDTTWNSQKSVSFPIVPNAEGYTEYTVDMGVHPGWQGTVGRLRLDLGAAEGTLSIDRIRIGRLGATDTIPPSRVSDLAITGSNTSGVTLSWTAKNDGPGEGRASFYDLRYSTVPITDDNWSAANHVEGEPLPAAAGEVQSMIVNGLSPGVLYHFSIRSIDGGGNVSALSNATSWASPGTAAYSWSFDTDNDFNGWTMQNHLSGSTVSEGALHLISNGNDPYALSPDWLSVNAVVYDKVRIRLRNDTSATAAQLFFITDTDSVWSASKSVTFTITPNDALYKEYTVGMGTNALWTGTVRQLRFDPFGVAGAMDVESIRLTD